jgi:hypothetical protein
MRWLIPRLADFGRTNPTSRCASPRAASQPRSARTGAAASSSATAPGRAWLPTSRCSPPTLLPVCAPRLAAGLKRSADLRGPSLLRVAHAAGDWPLWLKAAGVTRISARQRVSILRPGAAGRRRRAGHRRGHPALYRRRPRRRTAGRALWLKRAEGHAPVPGLWQLPDRAARFCRLPPLDFPRSVGQKIRRQGFPRRRRNRLSSFSPINATENDKKRKRQDNVSDVNGFTFRSTGSWFPRPRKSAGVAR